MNLKKQLLTSMLIFIFCAAGCAPAGPAPTPEATSVPTLAPTASPAPVNEKILAEALALSPANADLIEKLADLWTSNQIVADAAFYDEDSIALATGIASGSAGSGPGRVSNVELKGGSQVTLWDIRTNTQQDILFSGADKATYNRLVVSPDRKWIALAGSAMIVLGELQADAAGAPSFKSSKVDLSEIKEYGPLVGAAFSADSRLLAVIGQSGGILVWDVQAGRKFAALPVVIENNEMGLAGCIFSSNGAAFSADGKVLFYSCGDAIYTWDLSSTEPASLGMGGHTVFGLNPSGSLVAGGDYFGKVELWSYPVEDPGIVVASQLTLEGQATMITALAFSPDGSLLASASQDGKIVLYDVAQGSNLTTLSAPANFLSFSPDGKFLVSGTFHDGGALWGVRSGSLEAERAGVKVILSEGSVSLTDWNALIPPSWLAPEGSFPLHEIRISSDWVQKESCDYSGDDIRGFVTRRQPTVSVEIADVQTKTVLGQKVFEGGQPDECPETWTFNQLSPSDFIDGSAPEVEPFGAWLMEIMGKVGYE